MTRDELLAKARSLGWDAGTIDLLNGEFTLYASWRYNSSGAAPYAYLHYDGQGRPGTLKLCGLRQTGLSRAQRVALLSGWLEEYAPPGPLPQ